MDATEFKTTRKLVFDYRQCCRFAKIVLIIVAGLSARPGYGQSASKGTIYSRYGLGERIDFTSSRSQAMGGAGRAFRSANGTNFANPATLSDVIITRFTAGMIVQNVTETASGFEDSKLSSGYLTALQFSFPLISTKLGFGVSTAPYTRVAYHVKDGGAFQGTLGDTTRIPYGAVFSGNGGLQKISPALGYTVSRHLSVGASADIIFGILEEVQNTTFGNPDFEDGLVTKSSRLSALTGTFGVWYRKGRIFRRQDGIYLGATMTLPTSLKGDRVVTTGSGEFLDTLSTSRIKSVGLPFSGSLSVAYQRSNRFTVAFDVLYENWSGTSSDVSFPGVTGGGSTTFTDRYRVAGGLQYGGGSPNDSFFRRVLLRFGAYIDRSYVSPQAGTNINTVGVTGGFSLPTFFTGTVDMNFDLGRTGKTDNGLVRDRYFKFGLNFNFGERWFTRPKLR